MIFGTHSYVLVSLSLCAVLGQAVADSHKKEQPKFSPNLRAPSRIEVEKPDLSKRNLEFRVNQGALIPDLVPSGPVVQMHGLSVVTKKCDVTLKTKIKNIGNYVAASSKVGYYVDNNLKGTKPVNAIGSGKESSQKSLSLHGKKKSVSKGNHTFSFSADDKGNVGESDEGNNSKDITCTCDNSVSPTKSHNCK